MASASISKARLTCIGLGLFATYFWTFGVLDDGMILGNDALGYAEHLADGDGGEALWNPHHLLFHPLAAMVAWLLGFFGSSGSELRSPMALAMTAQTLVSALGGALAVLAFLRTAVTLAPRAQPTQLLLGALLAGSSCFWLYSAVGETYLPAVAAETALIGLAIRIALGIAGHDGQTRGGSSNTRRENTALISFLLLATLLRQDSVLAVVPLFLLLPARRALTVVGGAGVLCLAFYALAYGSSDVQSGFLPWMRGLSDTGLWGRTPDLVALATAGGMLGSALSYPLWFAGEASLTGQFSWSESGLDLALGLAPWLLALAAVGFSLRSGQKSRTTKAGSQPNRRPRVIAALALFAALRLGFFTWWQPSNMEYYCGTLPPLFFIAALCIGGERKAKTTEHALLASAVLIVVLGNWSALMGPNRSTAMHTRAHQTVVSAGPGGLALGLDRFGYYALMRAQKTWPIEHSTKPAVADISDAASGLVPSAVPHARARIAQALIGGGKVFAMRDMILPARFQHEPWALDWTDDQHVGTMNQIIENIRATPMDPDAGLASWLWQLE